MAERAREGHAERGLSILSELHHHRRRLRAGDERFELSILSELHHVARDVFGNR